MRDPRSLASAGAGLTMARGVDARLAPPPAGPPAGEPGGRSGDEERLRRGIDGLADQLCLAVDGNFDFLVRAPVEDEVLEKLSMLVNFVLDTARRGMSALREHNAVLSQLDQAKTVFFSNASHELRTPLTLILGPLEDALAGGERALSGQALETAHRNAVRLLRLVNTLLEFSRIEAGRLHPNYQPSDLAALTVDLAAVFRSAIEDAGLAFRVECPPLPRVVRVDREMWEKIVLNLISNAFKFTFAGEIAVRLRAEGESAVLEIADTGIGIAEAELPRLFERFHRIEGTRARTHEGFGIGLAMIHELVKIHGGSIEVASTPGAGTTFRVCLPLGDAPLSPADAAQDAPLHGAARVFADEAHAWLPQDARERDGAPAQGAQPARIIVADDNADMRAYICRVLEAHWTVEAHGDGALALQAARRAPPDLVVCDVMMPNVSGFELLRALRVDPQTRLVPVVLLSARAGQESIVDGFEAGADDYLVKPFSSRELTARVRTHLELSRLRLEAARTAIEKASLYERESAARAEAEAASRAKDEFLAMLSHELRNPLAPIMTALHVMELKGDESTRAERAMIRRQLVHVTRLVDDLLDVSRIMRGRVQLELERVAISRVVAKAVEIASPILEERRHRLDVSVPQDLVVWGDYMRLSQVLSNLLTNAAKYTDPGGLVEVSAGAQGGCIALRVRDNGIGIDAESLPRVFDLFTQGKQSIERSKGGLGLGLAIVRNLVQLHRGSVEARSPGRGKGSEFVVRLPPAGNDDPVASDTGHYAPLAAARTGRRILIVDDNADGGRSLALGLSLLGHTTRVAEDGPAGLDVVRDFRPEVALLDIGLPVMDGYELARRIQALPGPAPHLVAITGYGQPGDRERAHAAGFVEHLVKPVELPVVSRLVEMLCAKRRGAPDEADP